MSNQLLASIWYDGLPGFRQMNMILQFLEVCRIGLLFPFFSLAYIICPWASWSQKLRKPFIKFICTSFSYFTFLCKYLPHRLFPKHSPNKTDNGKSSTTPKTSRICQAKTQSLTLCAIVVVTRTSNLQFSAFRKTFKKYPISA